MKLGRALKDIRKEKGISQKDLCKEIGVSKTFMSLVENDVENPSTKLIHKIANHYKIPLFSIYWLATELTDVRQDKKEGFCVVKPIIDDLLKQFY